MRTFALRFATVSRKQIASSLRLRRKRAILMAARPLPPQSSTMYYVCVLIHVHNPFTHASRLSSSVPYRHNPVRLAGSIHAYNQLCLASYHPFPSPPPPHNTPTHPHTLIFFRIAREQVMFVGWVGDSKAILVRRETDDKDSRLKILELTNDHTCMKVGVSGIGMKAGVSGSVLGIGVSGPEFPAVIPFTRLSCSPSFPLSSLVGWFRV